MKIYMFRTMLPFNETVATPSTVIAMVCIGPHAISRHWMLLDLIPDIKFACQRPKGVKEKKQMTSEKTPLAQWALLSCHFDVRLQKKLSNNDVLSQR